MDTPSAEAAYMFTHALMQQACYQLMLPSVRGELHRRALEYLHTYKLAAPEELAGHALAGLDGASPKMAAQLKEMRKAFLGEAAEQAMAHFANERGVALLDQLLACEGHSAAERVRLRCRRAELLNRMGKMEVAIADAELALHEALNAAMEPEIARANLVLGGCCMDTAQNARTPALLSQAIEAFRRFNDSAMLEQALGALARAHFTAGKPEEALEPARAALELSEHGGDNTRIVRCRLLLMTILAQLYRNEEAQALASELAPVLETSPNPGLRCAVAAALASLSHGLNRPEEAGNYHKLASKDAAAGGLHAEVARAEVNLGGIALQLRRFSEGLHHLEVAEAMAREMGNMRVLWFALRNRYEIFDAVGDFRSALHAATSAARVAEGAGMAWHFLVSSAPAAAAFLELGQGDDALEWVEAALRAPRSGQFLNFILAKLHAQRACALFRLGNAHLAMESVQQMEHFLGLAGSEPGEDSQRWIQEARSLNAP